MKWKTILDNWYKGKNLPDYPKKIKKPYIWRTSKISQNENSIFKQEFIEHDFLDTEQNYDDFLDYIQKSKNKYTVYFNNLSKDTILVIPFPKKYKNFSNLKNFIDQASTTHQKLFWKKVVKLIRNELKYNKFIWLSTHGLGVPYLHVRISNKPKYYGISKLIY